MATTKPTPAKEVQEVQEVQVEKVTTEKVEAPVAPTKPAPKAKPQIDLKMMVPVRNITNGSLTYVSRKTGNEAHWSEFGDVEYFEVAELQTMKTSQPRFFNEPWVMIDDEDVVDYLGLRHMYDRIIADHEIATFFYNPVEEIIAKLQKAPNGTRDLVASKAREMVENGSLDSIRVIRALEKELTIDLSMVAN